MLPKSFNMLMPAQNRQFQFPRDGASERQVEREQARRDSATVRHVLRSPTWR
jgi:hypothetical protein